MWQAKYLGVSSCSLKLERCKEDYIDFIEYVEERVFRVWERYPRGLIELLCDRCGSTSFLAFYCGAAVGYVIACLEPGCRGHIISIGVLPEYRRRGIGRALLCEALRALRGACAEKVYLEVREDNDVAIRLYTSTGFKVVEYLPRYYSDGGGAYRMVLTSEPKCPDQYMRHS